MKVVRRIKKLQRKHYRDSRVFFIPIDDPLRGKVGIFYNQSFKYRT